MATRTPPEDEKRRYYDADTLLLGTEMATRDAGKSKRGVWGMTYLGRTSISAVAFSPSRFLHITGIPDTPLPQFSALRSRLHRFSQ
jgi:hypothetical protein